jgi:hypothetical protein
LAINSVKKRYDFIYTITTSEDIVNNGRKRGAENELKDANNFKDYMDLRKSV